MPSIKIRDREIGLGWPTYIIAELSANHNQDFGQAIKLIEAAKEAGADAVKLQTYTPDTITIDCRNEIFMIGKGTVWEGKNLYELYREAHTPWEWQPKLKVLAEKLDLACFSTPFDHSAVDFLEAMNVPAYKVASFELVDIPLLKKVAATGKPVILSTGMAAFVEIEEAVQTLRSVGCGQIALLQCTSAYPAPPEEMNLRTIPHLSQIFDVPAGLSDHTLGITAPVAAVVLGACIIEKHLTLSRSVPGPDNLFSLEKEEFKNMVRAVREAEKALGKISYETTEQEKHSLKFRRSLFVVENMEAGQKFDLSNVRSIRPAHGLHTRHLDEIIGRKAAKPILRGTPLSWDLIK
ncbi:MAG: pseudaminic acid synthase [Desulfobacteraceae bacterium]|nr:MAG: pseudaminic acid synthase [Desulfobacteraceae bacterium]